MLDYFLDSKKIEWSRVQPYIDLSTSDSTQEEMGAFFDAIQGKPVPEGVRAVVERRIPNLKADVMVSKSTLSLTEAQQAIGKEDESKSGTIFTPAEGPRKFLQGTWYRYGAVQVGVDQAGVVQGLRVDLAQFKG